MEKKLKVLWLTNIPSPYRVDFFNEFGKLCNLTVIFEKKSSTERNESWKEFQIIHFKAIFLKGISIGVAEAFCPKVIKYLQRKLYDCIFVTNFSDLTGMLAIMVLQMKKIPYIIESDGGFAGSGRGIKEKLKKILLSKACMYFSTGKNHDEYYQTYGARENELIRYPFTSLHSEDILLNPVSLEQKNKLRTKLKMKERYIVLAVGQFIPRKGYDILIKAFSYLDSDIGCYIVGGKDLQSYADMISDLQLSNIHFVEFKKKQELNEYYMAADMFVHPCREDIWGLVINEAMAKGLPIITTERCGAGIALITNSVIGKIIPIEDIDSLIKAIKDTLESVSTKTNEAVLEAIRPYTIEKMARKHIKALERVFSEKKEYNNLLY